MDSDNFHLGRGYSVLGLGLSDNFHLGRLGGILKLLDLDSVTIFIGGVYSVHGLGLSDNFHFWGGILYSDLDSLTIFIWGGILYSDLDSLTIFIGGRGEGRGRGVFYRIRVNCRIWTKISTTPAGSCITDSLSHTTYVETNQIW